MSTDTKPATPVDPRAVELLAPVPSMDALRLLFCFQALSLPKGMTLTRGFTRTEAAKRINAFLGLKAVTRSSKPPRNADGLEGYMTWAIAEAERRNGPLTLEAVSE